MITEQQINELETEIRALKATYPVAGANVRFYVTESQPFDVTGGGICRIKFSADKGHGSDVFIRLRAVVTYNGNEVFREQVTEPQDGSGDVVIAIQMGVNPYNYVVRVIASGASSGTFAII